jgi:hypothetical protein
MTDERATKKASQKKTLKAAAKQLQKELNNRMNEVVTRIRKETKAKLKEVVKEATRRMDGDTERMFEQALHTIVKHYDSVSASMGGGNEAGDSNDNGAAGNTTEQSPRSGKQSQTLNKDGSPRKPRATAAAGTSAAATPGKRGRKPGSATAAKKPAGTATGAKRGPKPRIQAPATTESNDVRSSATGEVSE